MNFSLCVLLIAIEEIKKKQMKKKQLHFLMNIRFLNQLKDI